MIPSFLDQVYYHYNINMPKVEVLKVFMNEISYWFTINLWKNCIFTEKTFELVLNRIRMCYDKVITTTIYVSRWRVFAIQFDNGHCLLRIGS